MRPTLLLSTLFAACLACACAQQQATPVPGTCNAQAAQFAVGYIFTDALVDEVRRRSGAKLARVVRPGRAVTMDFSAERVNLEIEAGNRVAKVRCG
ncbi:MAG: hypothetical protein JWP65_2581 [Ramlibacter sp.]|jgi:hypothetical protein|uniref:I78 family peptidase inhibitor n=1 Tax=Ramlibacter sp. TaxID=1917967 RepID=UPI00261B579A|nr:I78 family peptidase inhibitor [Ramlibacter sp.]MDB5752160.1 hypothetical protein [Ramlibacter sp.]